ncbi:hypothetical protein D3C72_2179670 [compost metagenome]
MLLQPLSQSAAVAHLDKYKICVRRQIPQAQRIKADIELLAPLRINRHCPIKKVLIGQRGDGCGLRNGRNRKRRAQASQHGCHLGLSHAVAHTQARKAIGL